MTEHHPHSTEPAPIPFTSEQIKQFDADDAEAGSAIGKMLSVFFLYTVIAMIISALATYWWVTTSTVH